MAKFTILTNLIILILVHLSSVTSTNDRCDNNIFILISTQNVFLLNFDSDNSPNIIYQTNLNTTIENGFYHKRTNTIILLINQFNQTYSLILLNVYDDIYNSWKEKSNKIIFSSYVFITLGQLYLYVLNNQTYLLQIFTLPLKSTPYKQHFLTNLPKTQTLSNYIIDENFHLLWILFENTQSQVYACDLKTYECHLYMNLVNLKEQAQLYIDWKHQKFYMYSKEHLIIFEYNHNQTDYSINYLDSNDESQDKFLTVCSQNSNIEYLSIDYNNNQQVCYHKCQHLPSIVNDKSLIHIVQRLSTLSDVLYCSRKRHITKIIVLILILIDIIVILGFIAWLTYKYFNDAMLNNEKNQMNHGVVFSLEKDSVTHF